MISFTYLQQYIVNNMAVFSYCYALSICSILFTTSRYLAAPIPPEPMPKQVVFPSTKGYKWSYDINGDSYREIITRSIVKKDVVEIIISPVVDGVSFEDECAILEVSSKGICLPVVSGEKVDDPYWPLIFPLSKGKRWEWGHKDSVFGSDTCMGIDNIKVPAGTFRCIHIESVEHFKNSRDVTHSWYADNVGLVKRTYGKSVQILVSHGLRW